MSSNEFVMLKSATSTKTQEQKEKEKETCNLFDKYLESVLSHEDFPTMLEILDRFYEGTLKPVLLASIKQNCASIKVTVPFTVKEKAVYMDEDRHSTFDKIKTFVKTKVGAAGLKKCQIGLEERSGGFVEVSISRYNVEKLN